MIGDVRQHLTQPSFGIDAVQLGSTLHILLQLTDLFAVALALLTKFPAQLPGRRVGLLADLAPIRNLLNEYSCARNYLITALRSI